MSLLSENMEPCVILNKVTELDGYGGFINKWARGAEFQAAIVYNTSLEAKVAEKSGVKDLYTVTTRKNNYLEYHDVFQRESDGQIFRVTSDSKDNKTPKGAGLNMRQVSAEEYILPDGQITGS